MNIIERIDSAKDLEQAFCFSGSEGDGFDGQIAYITFKRGKRAMGGFFQRTRANVRTKFAKVWLEEHQN